MPPTSAKSGVTTRAAQAAETRQRLVAAAVDLFSERSYADVAAADIAKAAGVAHGLLFHYFGSKRGIFVEAMRDAAKELDNAFTFEASQSATHQLRRALAARLDYLSQHRGLALRLVLGGRGEDPEAWEVFEAARWRALDATAAILGLDPKSHALRMAGRSLVSAYDEATIYWLNNDEPFSVDVMVDYMIQLGVSALRSAATLDPTIDITSAIETLLDAGHN
jgi:AcrR family transcriptional regulator